MPPPTASVESGASAGLRSVTIQIEGTLVLHDNFTAWPMTASGDGTGKFVDAFHFSNCTDLTVTGSGTVQGQGETWWWAFFNGSIPRQRPTMFYFEDARRTIVEKVTLLNAPRFNIYGANVDGFIVRKMKIWVDLDLQRQISGQPSSSMMPMFPFNTDGVDFKGRNVHLHDLIVSNYDDVVAVKPTVGGCTENALVERISITAGAGLSIGSVPPTPEGSCIRNITFRDSVAVEPLKFIYIKTGESKGDEGENRSALIENIYYRNLTAHSPVAWSIYLGPQQQSEPDGTGEGWFGVPTEPRVTVRNIFFEDITVKGSTLRAGLLRCNSSNPCTGVHFKNVRVSGKLADFEGGYICDVLGSVEGEYDEATSPAPEKCLLVGQ